MRWLVTALRRRALQLGSRRTSFVVVDRLTDLYAYLVAGLGSHSKVLGAAL